QGKTPSLEVAFPKAVTVHRVLVRGQRNGPGFFVSKARLELLGPGGVLVQSIESVDLPAPGHDADVVLPGPVSDVRSVRFTALEGDRSPGLAEFTVIGEGELGVVRHAAQDVVFTGTGLLEARVVRADDSPLRDYVVRVSGPVQFLNHTTNQDGGT